MEEDEEEELLPYEGLKILQLIKMVQNFANCSYIEALRMDVELFHYCVKEQYILQMLSTEKGRERLKLIKRLNTKTADTKKLRECFGKGGN